MKPLSDIARFLAVGFAMACLLACGDKMERAKQALDDISRSVATNWVDGTTYVPAEVAHVQQELADLQAAYGRRNYAAVLSRAPAVLTDAKALAADAAARKSRIVTALHAQWSGLAATVPQWIVTVENRLTALAKHRRASKGLDLSIAKAALADAEDGWGRAQEAMASGDLKDAVATGKDVEAKTEAAAVALKLELPAAG